MIQHYTALEGQNIYDLAMIVYANIRGLGKMINDNPEVFDDIDQEFYQGAIIEYDDEAIFEGQLPESLIRIREFEPIYYTLQGQTVYDLAIQLYGSVEDGLRQLVPFYSSIGGIGAVIPAGTPIIRKRATDPIGQVYRDNEWTVATFELDWITFLAERVHDFEFNITFE